MNRPDLPAGPSIALHRRALVACDNPRDLEILAKLLENQGLEVHTAHDGTLALELLKCSNFDLVFLGSEGYATLLKIKEHPRTNLIPVLITTAPDQLDEAVRCLEEGVIRQARDGDIGAIFGIGFAPFRGGPLRFVDAVGAAELVRRLEALAAKHGDRFAPCKRVVAMAGSGARVYDR